MKKLRMLFLLGGTLLLGVAPLAAQNSVVSWGEGHNRRTRPAAPPLQVVFWRALTGAPTVITETSPRRSRRTSTTPAVRRPQLLPPPRRGQSAWPIAVCSPGFSPPRSPTARQEAPPGTRSLLS